MCASVGTTAFKNKFRESANGVLQALGINILLTLNMNGYMPVVSKLSKVLKIGQMCQNSRFFYECY